jgi:hypothetical protein
VVEVVEMGNRYDLNPIRILFAKVYVNILVVGGIARDLVQ